MKSLNPGYKLLSLILASLLLSVTFHIRLNLLIAAVCLLVTFCTPGVNRRRLLLGMLPFFWRLWACLPQAYISERTAEIRVWRLPCSDRGPSLPAI